MTHEARIQEFKLAEELIDRARACLTVIITDLCENGESSKVQKLRICIYETALINLERDIGNLRVAFATNGF